MDLLDKIRIGIKLRFRIRNEVWPQHSSWHIPKLNHSTIYHFFTFYVFLFVLTCVVVIGNNCTCKSFEACFIISIYYIKRSSNSSKKFFDHIKKETQEISHPFSIHLSNIPLHGLVWEIGNHFNICMSSKNNRLFSYNNVLSTLIPPMANYL